MLNFNPPAATEQFGIIKYANTNERISPFEPPLHIISQTTDKIRRMASPRTKFLAEDSSLSGRLSVRLDKQSLE